MKREFHYTADIEAIRYLGKDLLQIEAEIVKLMKQYPQSASLVNDPEADQNIYRCSSWDRVELYDILAPGKGINSVTFSHEERDPFSIEVSERYDFKNAHIRHLFKTPFYFTTPDVLLIKSHTDLETMSQIDGPYSSSDFASTAYFIQADGTPYKFSSLPTILKRNRKYVKIENLHEDDLVSSPITIEELENIGMTLTMISNKLKTGFKN